MGALLLAGAPVDERSPQIGLISRKVDKLLPTGSFALGINDRLQGRVHRFFERIVFFQGHGEQIMRRDDVRKARLDSVRIRQCFRVCGAGSNERSKFLRTRLRQRACALGATTRRAMHLSQVWARRLAIRGFYRRGDRGTLPFVLD